MKRNTLFNLAIAVTILFSSNTLLAKDFKIGSVVISDPWARASAGPAKTGAAYIGKISNHGKTADRLIAASSPAAKRVTVHQNIIENGIAKMRRAKALAIKPGHSVSLKPGGYHIMMVGLQTPLKTGETFPLTLTFEQAGKIEVSVTVKKIGFSHRMHSNHDKMDHEKMHKEHEKTGHDKTHHDKMKHGDMKH